MHIFGAKNSLKTLYDGTSSRIRHTVIFMYFKPIALLVWWLYVCVLVVAEFTNSMFYLL